MTIRGGDSIKVVGSVRDACHPAAMLVYKKLRQKPESCRFWPPCLIDHFTLTAANASRFACCVRHDCFAD